MSSASAAHLGELELRVLLAVLQCGEEAYGVTILRDVERCTGRAVSRGAVYVTLERLEKKRLVRSSMGKPTAIRGGRAKRLFRVRPAGLRALRESLSVLTRLQEGLEAILEER